MNHVIYLIPDNRPLTEEEREGWRFLSHAPGIRAKKVSLAQAARSPSRLAVCDVLWWHCDGEYPSAEQLPPSVLEAMRACLAKKRGLLLSLLAPQMLGDLGIEHSLPNVVTHGSWSEESWAVGYPDMRGFAGFGKHPIFNGFHGGLFTWAPRIGESYSASYYEKAVPDSGAVVGVEKLYVTLNEERRTIIEYQYKKASILTVGTNFYFSDRKQRFRPHLERFALNCLNYLRALPASSSKRTRIEKSYWAFGPATISAFKHEMGSLGRVSARLPKLSSGLEIHRDSSPNGREEQFFDLTGRRLLIMGKELSGIAEVWSNPTRIFKSIKVGFKVGDRAWQWSHELHPTITIKPESLTRRYVLEGASIEEVVFASLHSPAGVMHYKISSTESVDIFISAESDLRMMWPLSEHTTGSLQHSWDSSGQAAVITDQAGRNAAIIGSSCKPADHLIGKFLVIEPEADRLVGKPTEQMRVCAAFRLSLKPTVRQCAVVFAGSSSNTAEALRAYRGTMKSIQGVLREQVKHYERLFSGTVRLKTPSESLNKAFRWSVAGTDKFFVETPGLGSSFVAGYGLTSGGWNGGHKESGRPGYAWYFGRDSLWTAMAALNYGDFDKVRAVLEFLGRHQDLSGKILHEMTASGHAHFDAADSTPLYLILLGRYVRASGDVTFARKEFAKVTRALSFCYSTDADGDHLIENTNVGHGWIEGGKLFPAHSEYYLSSCWAEALAETSYLADALKEHQLSLQCKRESKKVSSILRREFKNDDTGFYDFAKNADGSFRPEKTVLSAVGMMFNCAEEEFAQRSLSELASNNFSSDWGVRMVGNNDRLFDPTGYHYGSIWPLFTGWTALAEFQMNRPVQGFGHLLSNALLAEQFSAGCVEEVLHGTRLIPSGVCPHQAWSGTMIAQPLLEGMLGLKADARSLTLHMRPYFPPHWNNCEVQNIHVGGSRVTMVLKREHDATTFTFSRRQPAKTGSSRPIKLILRPVFPLGTRFHDLSINGRRKHLRLTLEDYRSLPVIHAVLDSSTEIRLSHSHGIAIIPPTPHLARGEESQGLRVIDEQWESGKYQLTLEGRAGGEYLIDVFDPSQSVGTIDGATQLSRERGHHTMSVIFPAHVSDHYVRRVVSMTTH